MSRPLRSLPLKGGGSGRGSHRGGSRTRIWVLPNSIDIIALGRPPEFQLAAHPNFSRSPPDHHRCATMIDLPLSGGGKKAASRHVGQVSRLVPPSPFPPPERGRVREGVAQRGSRTRIWVLPDSIDIIALGRPPEFQLAAHPNFSRSPPDHHRCATMIDLPLSGGGKKAPSRHVGQVSRLVPPSPFPPPERGRIREGVAQRGVAHQNLGPSRLHRHHCTWPPPPNFSWPPTRISVDPHPIIIAARR